jgi:hypothetical protein
MAKPGIGKSRIVAELEKRLRGEPQVTMLANEVVARRLSRELGLRVSRRQGKSPHE